MIRSVDHGCAKHRPAARSNEVGFAQGSSDRHRRPRLHHAQEVPRRPAQPPLAFVVDDLVSSARGARACSRSAARPTYCRMGARRSSQASTRRCSASDRAGSSRSAWTGRSSAVRAPYRAVAKCRSIRTLANFPPPATDEEICAALSGASRPSRANEQVFERAVDEVTAAACRARVCRWTGCRWCGYVGD